MAHTPYPYSDENKENPSIVASNDGEYWIVPNGLTNPIDSPNNSYFRNINKTTHHMSDVDLIEVNGRLELFYRYRARGEVEQIYRKISTDGINWSDRELVISLPDRGNRLLSPSVVYENGKYRMYLVDAGKIVYKESNTGNYNDWKSKIKVDLNYEDDSLIPWHLSVYKDNDEYILLLNAVRKDYLGEFDKKNRVLAVGTSRDGKSFKGIDTIISKSDVNFDNYYIYRASMVKVDGVFKLYYSARNTYNYWRIGKVEGVDIYNLFY